MFTFITSMIDIIIIYMISESIRFGTQLFCKADKSQASEKVGRGKLVPSFKLTL